MMSEITVKSIHFTQNPAAYLQIWEQCFPGESDFANRFLSAFGGKTGLAVFEKQNPVSMAFFLPSVLHTPTVDFSARYVYAVATLPAYRGRGYAAHLLSEGARRFSADVLYLHPAEPSLEGFYRKLGFHACLFSDRMTLESEPENGEDTVSFEITRFDPAEYLTARNAFYKDKPVVFSEFPPTLLSRMCEELSLLKFSDGMAVFAKDAHSGYLLETLAAPEKIPALCGAVRRHWPQLRISALFPGNTEVTGMVLPLSASAQKLFSTTAWPFSGLWLDM